MDKLNIEKYERKSITTSLKDFCYLSGDHAFIEITEWHNGDGYDICIEDKDSKHISLTRGELQAIEALTKLL